MAFRQTILLALLICFTFASSAKIRYWVGNGSNTDWNSTGNWAASSGGASGSTVPATNDTAHFDNGGTGNCAFNINVSIKYFTISSGYSGTISQGSNTFSIGTTGADFGGGTFSGGSAAISSTGPMIISGTSFTSTSATFSMSDDFTVSSGSFSANSGNIKFAKTCTITGSVTLEDLEFNGAANAAYTIASGTTLTVNGELNIGATGNFSLLGGTIDAKGDITVTNTSSGGSRTTQLNITGTANQVITGSGVAGTGYLPSVNIDKSGGTLTLNSVISIMGNWIYVAGTVDATSNNSTVLINGSSLDGQGTSSTMTFYGLSIYNTVTLQGKALVASDLMIYSSKTLNTNSTSSYEVEIMGDLKVHGTIVFNSSDFKFTGSGDNAISGSVSSSFYDMTVNKPGGSLQFGTPVTIAHNLTLTSGNILTSTTNILTIENGATVTGGSALSYVEGPMQKTGNSSFSFPIGGSGKYRPLEITAPSSATEKILAQYYPLRQAVGDNLDNSFSYLSQCEHWKLTNPTSGSPAIKATLHFEQDDCVYAPSSDFIISEWSSALQRWDNRGNGGVTGTVLSGAVISLNNLVNFTYLTLGSLKGIYNYIPIKAEKYNGGYNIVSCWLACEFKEDYQPGNFNYAIYDESRNLKMSPDTYPIQKLYGENYVRINLKSISGFESGKMYFLEITDEKKVTYVTKFKYQPSGCPVIASPVYND